MSAQSASTHLYLFQQAGIRTVVSLLGSYTFVWGFLTLGIAASVAAGAAYEEAYTGFKLLAFLLYLALFLWSFATKYLLRGSLILFGGGAAMTALALILQNQLIQGA